MSMQTTSQSEPMRIGMVKKPVPGADDGGGVTAAGNSPQLLFAV